MSGSEVTQTKNVDALLNDFTLSERNYVSKMKFLIEEFWTPLKWKQDDNTNHPDTNLESSSSSFVGHTEHIRIVFGSLEAIITVNSQLVHHLESMKDKSITENISPNNNNIMTESSISSEDEKATRDFFFSKFDSNSIGSLFLCLIPVLKIYVTYMTNYQEAIRILNSPQYQSDLLFQGLLADCMSKRSDFALETYLAEPLGRISLYENYIKDFMVILKEASPQLSLALVRLNGVCGYLDTKMKEVENIQKLTSVQKLIKGLDESLVIPSRRYIKEGELELVAGIHKDIFTRFKRHAFLFNDALFITKSEKKRSFGKKTVRPTSVHGRSASQSAPSDSPSLTPAQASTGRRFSLSGLAASLTSTLSQTFNKNKQNTSVTSKVASLEAQNSEPSYDFIFKIDFNDITSLQQLDVKNHLDSLKQDCFVIAITYVFDDDEQDQESLFLGFEAKTESDEWFECISQNVETTKQQTEFYQREARKIATLKAEQARAILGQQYLNYRIHGPNPTGFPTSVSPQNESPPSEISDAASEVTDDGVSLPEVPSDLGKGSLRQKRSAVKTVFKMSSSERIQSAEVAQNNYHTLLEKQKEIEKYHNQQRALKFERMKQKYLTMPQLPERDATSEKDGSSRSIRIERAKEKPKYGTVVFRSRTRDSMVIPRNTSVPDVSVTLDATSQNNNNNDVGSEPSSNRGVGPTLNIPPTQARKEFAELLADPLGFECFSQFLKEHFAQENLAFLLDIQDLQTSPDDEVVVKGERIYRRYIKSSKLNLAYSIKESIVTFFNQPRSKRTPEAVRHVFDNSQEAVIELLRLDNYRRFMKSGYYSRFTARE